ncbi:LysR family transcriptional regulator [Ramlibacter tataouinensis]|uniref:LysR family transcriptional regulator n=1 Tax=Ramlibacter tataouinensis TaxID=94132 RepID=UPI0022F3A875|nr:LysR family transcriptional regulator [Ramlibacter tataouinensis]WBY03313.1 LysR family transcriptional regulator [Ramlibacter tataouinensis]
MDRLQSMRVFQQVALEGGFAAAARKLDLSPAVVTRLVSDLEKHLGVRLLQRTTRRLSLTQAGDAYLDRLRGILAEIDEADAMVQAHTREMTGTVRVLAPPVAATHMVAPAVVAFQKLHPAVRVELHVEDSPDPAVHDYDLAVLSSVAALDSSVIARPIIDSQTVFCASPDYLARHGEPRVPEDLLRHRCLRLRLTGARLGPLRLIDPTDDDRQLELDLPGALTANHTDTLVRATLDGGGISSQPIDLLAPLIQAGRLRRVLAPWITARVSLVAVLPSRQYMPARTRAFVDCLVEHTRRLVAGLTLEPPQLRGGRR